MDRKPRIAITYCTQCNWLLRAAWMAQELLSTFSDELGEVALKPATAAPFTSRSKVRSFGSANATAVFPM